MVETPGAWTRGPCSELRRALLTPPGPIRFLAFRSADPVTQRSPSHRIRRLESIPTRWTVPSPRVPARLGATRRPRPRRTVSPEGFPVRWTAPSSRVPTRWATARRRHPASRFTKRLPGPPTARSPRFPARRAATRRSPTRRAFPPEGFLAGRIHPPEDFRIRWHPIRRPNSTTPWLDKIGRSTMKNYV